MTYHDDDDRRPLFVPLTAVAFEWWASGCKRWEVRRFALRWGQRNVYPARVVVLARGYGWPRLRGRVGSAFFGPLSELHILPPSCRPTLDEIVPGAAGLADVVRAAGLSSVDDAVTAFEVVELVRWSGCGHKGETE
jgi:hypothetical protein